MPHLFAVTETFQVTNLGLAIGRLELEDLERLDVEFNEVFEVELRRPDGSIQRAQAVVPVQFLAPLPRDGPSYAVFMPQAAKADVQVGTEVWIL